MTAVYYVHHQFVPESEAKVPSEERGHQFGDGVYEVVRVYGGRPFLLNWHLNRLDRSCRAIGIDNPHTDEEWTELIHEAIRRSGVAESTVYWQVTRGVAARSHVFPNDSAPAVTLTVREVTTTTAASGKLLCLPDERFANAWVKTLNLLPNVIAKESARQSGCTEALLWRDGRVTEGSSTNAWFVCDGELWTHPANRFILGGITRQLVMQLAQELNINVHEQAITLADLPEMDGIFITSTTQEVLPIVEVLVDEAVLPELTQLPQNAPADGLVRPLASPRVLWHGQMENDTIRQLQAAYQAAVSRVAYSAL